MLAAASTCCVMPMPQIRISVSVTPLTVVKFKSVDVQVAFGVPPTPTGPQLAVDVLPAKLRPADLAPQSVATPYSP